MSVSQAAPVHDVKAAVRWLRANAAGFGLSGSTGELARSASPRHRVHAGVPPHLILHVDRDAVVNHEGSRVLHEALSAVGAQSMYVLNQGETRSGRPSIGSPAPDVEGTQISNLETYANRPGVISPEGY